MIKILRYRKWKKIIEKSGLFDVKHYLFAYPDVRQQDINPVMHYIKYGVNEGRNPNKEFDTKFYLRTNEDVNLLGVNPLVHFILYGKDEGRQTILKKSTRTDNIINADLHKKQKIIVVSHDAYPHGGQYLALNIGRTLNKIFNYEVAFILRGGGILVEEFEKVGDVHHFYNLSLEEQKNLLEQLYNRGFKKAIANTSVVGYEVEKIVNVKIKVVSLIHEMSKTIEKMNLLSSIEKINEKADAIVLPNLIVEKDIKNIFNFNKEKIKIIPQGLFRKNIYKFNKLEARKKLCNELGISLDSKIILNIAYGDHRKGIDIFTEIASKIIEKNEKVHFVWVGNFHFSLMQNIQKKFINNKNKKNLHFVGQQSNIDHYYAGSDLFFLTSREDPFPSVVLDAMNCALPVIAFKNCGGFEEIIEDKELLLDINNIDASVKFVIDFLDNDNSKVIGDKNQKLIDTKFSFNNYIYNLLDLLGEKIKKVSVIVPSYNHEKYIKERLESILNQSYPVYEIIFLDDKSSDNSVKIANEILSNASIDYKIIVNKQNSGSPFIQWQKGIDLAQGEIIWIAEGDDSCSTNFLNTLVPYFSDPLVNIAFSKVEMMNERSEINPDWFTQYFNDACANKFHKNYIKTGNQEINEQLGAVNTLINASGLLIRKSSFGKNLEYSQNHKMCGDWLIYVECLKNGKIAYDTRAINYFRRHASSQVAKTEGSEEYFKEREEISKYVLSNFIITEKLKHKIFEVIDKEWDRFSNKHPNKTLEELFNKKELLKISENKEGLPSLCVIVSDLSPGGGQLFSIRLANAWKKIGGNVVLLNVDRHQRNLEVVKKISKDVTCFDINEINFKDIIKVYDIDVVHSSIWWADKYVFENIDKIDTTIKWVLTMHGCYESLLENPHWDQKFLEYFPKMLNKVDSWVYTAEKNKKIFEKYSYPKNLTKILNGYEPETPIKIERKSLGIDEDSLVLCLATRAIKSKGWYEAVEVVNNLNKNGYKVDLLLIGEGEAALDLQSKQSDKKYIHFLGQVSNLADYIALSDIGILPTTFIGESMPLVLIEFMAQEKPIISTNVGEIKSMMQDDAGSSGIVLELVDNKINIKEFEKRILELYIDKQKIKEFSNNSKRLFENFKMDKMIHNYIKIYKSEY